MIKQNVRITKTGINLIQITILQNAVKLCTNLVAKICWKMYETVWEDVREQMEKCYVCNKNRVWKKKKRNDLKTDRCHQSSSCNSDCRCWMKWYSWREGQIWRREIEVQRGKRKAERKWEGEGKVRRKRIGRGGHIAVLLSILLFLLLHSPLIHIYW